MQLQRTEDDGGVGGWSSEEDGVHPHLLAFTPHIAYEILDNSLMLTDIRVVGDGTNLEVCQISISVTQAGKKTYF